MVSDDIRPDISVAPTEVDGLVESHHLIRPSHKSPYMTAERHQAPQLSRLVKLSVCRYPENNPNF